MKKLEIMKSRNRNFINIDCRNLDDLYSSILIFVFNCLIERKGQKTITVVNNCTFRVWPGIQSGTVTKTYKRVMEPGDSFTVEVPIDWGATICGRIRCSSDPKNSSRLVCQSGDCQNLLKCEFAAEGEMTRPYTRAIFDQDRQKLDIQKGYNLPMLINYGNSEALGSRCDSQYCAAFVGDICPPISQLKLNNEVIGCTCSDCDTYTSTCSPAEYTRAFKDACPELVPFRFGEICENATTLFLSFCPAPGKH